MPDAVRRSALDGHLFASTPSDAAQVLLRERRPDALAMILGADDGAALGAALSTFNLTSTPSTSRCTRGEGVRLLWVGPGQFLVESSRHREDELERSLATAVAPLGAVAVDLSHARTVFRLEGARAVDVIAKGCPLDLEAMRDGDTASSVLGHFSIALHRDDAAFELYVMRTFGLACFEWLTIAGAEFAMHIIADTVSGSG